MATKPKISKQPTNPKSASSKLVLSKPLRQHTRDELVHLAASLKLKHHGKATKTQLSSLLNEHVVVKETKPAKPKRKTSKNKIDWNKAFAWFIEDHTRSYADVAKEFGVAKRTVEQNAKVTYKDDTGATVWASWSERRHMLGEITRKKAEEDYKKSAPVRSAEHLKQYRNLQIAASNKVTMLAMQGQWLIDPNTGKKVKVQEFDARQLADVAKALKLAIDGERVIMGLATSVATIKPGSDDDTGKGWGELLALAMKQANEQS